MKQIKLENFTTKTRNRLDGSQIPAGTWEPTPLEPKLIQSGHPFLQCLLDRKMFIYKCLDELTVFIASSILWLRVYDDHIQVRYIATYEDQRQQKSGTYSMRLLCGIADAIHTTLRLTTDVVTELEGRGQIPAHPALIQAVKGNVRIPAPQLVEWFQKFGFIQGKRSRTKHVDYQGFHMERTPQPTKE